jgi:hypothetical protein
MLSVSPGTGTPLGDQLFGSATLLLPPPTHVRSVMTSPLLAVWLSVQTLMPDQADVVLSMRHFSTKLVAG